MDGVVADHPGLGRHAKVESFPHRKLAEHPTQYKERHRIDTVSRETFRKRLVTSESTA
jgi:hypothetical protein